MFKLTIEAASAADLKKQLTDLVVHFGYSVVGGRVNPSDFSASAEVEVKTQQEIPLEEPKKTKTKKDKGEVKEKVATETKAEPERSTDSEEVPVAAPSAPPTHAKPGPKPTHADASRYLQAVNSKKGLPVARQMLLDFKCARVSELQNSQLDDFIQACKKAVA